MAITATYLLIPALLLGLLLPLALFSLLQVFLCRRGPKWLGLILPGLSLALSLVLCLSMAGYSTVSVGSEVIDSRGHMAEHHEQVQHIALTPGAVGAVTGVFFVANIPTVVFGGIWLHYKNRRDWKDDLKKMNIEDLE